METLYKLAGNSSHPVILRIPNGTHNESWKQGGAMYMSTIAAFIEHVMEPSRTSSPESQ
jgi:hypothetical protein